MPRPTAPAATTGAPDANKPVHEIRHRNIRAVIWKNQTAKGAMYDVQVTRSYRDGDTWRDSHSFGYDDLLVVAKLMYDAHSAITMLRAKDKATSEHTSEPQAQPQQRAAGKRREQQAT
jgi:hypothetical protein